MEKLKPILEWIEGIPPKTRGLYRTGTIYLVLIWIIVVPRGFPLREALLGHPGSDLAKHYWNLWWFRQMVQDHQFPFKTVYLNFPNGLYLYPIEPINGIFTVALGGVFGLVLLTNLLSIACLVFAALAMYALIRHLTNREGAAFSAGLIFGLSSYVLWTVHLGVGELQHIGWVPLSLLWLIKTRENPSYKRAVWTAVLFIVTTLACWYYGMFLYLLSGLYMVSHPLATEGGRREHLHLWGRYATVFLLSMALVYPIIHVFNKTYSDEPPMEEGFFQWLDQQDAAKSHDGIQGRIDFLVIVSGHENGYDPAMHNPYQAGGAYLGPWIVVLAIIGFFMRPREGAMWLVAALVSALFGAGSVLVWNGNEFPMGSAEAPKMLPFYFVNLFLEHRGQPMNFPMRFMAVLTIASTVLVGFFLAWLQDYLKEQRRTKRIATLLTAMAFLVILLQFKWRGDIRIPYAEHPIPDQPVAERLKQEKGEHGVVELPFIYSDDRGSRDQILLMQVIHGKPTASLPIDRLSHYHGGYRLSVKDTSLARLVNATDLPSSNKVADEELIADMAWMRHKGFHWLIIDTEDQPVPLGEYTHGRLQRLLGPPLERNTDRALYRIQQFGPPPSVPGPGGGQPPPLPPPAQEPAPAPEAPPAPEA